LRSKGRRRLNSLTSQIENPTPKSFTSAPSLGHHSATIRIAAFWFRLMNRCNRRNASAGGLFDKGGIAKGVATDLESLDKRSFERSIVQELARINSRPVELSAIENAKSALESELKYLTGLREVATPKEASELDAHITRRRTQLAKIRKKLAAHADREKVDPKADLPSEMRGAESSATTIQDGGIDYVRLFNQVLERGMQSGESQKVVLADFLKEHPGISRTQVTDYRAGRTQGRVSPGKCRTIEAAILASAARLGLTTRTSSD
jgi:hypothetical protein